MFEAPLALTAIVDESTLSGSGAVRVVSVQGVDAAHLVLTDTDLSDCLFSGAFHLGQLRLEGRTTLASTPTPSLPRTPTTSPRCTGSSARRSRTARTNPGPPTSTTASAVRDAPARPQRHSES
ncbi:hypothetical protein GCM10010286_01160 [Streptomyces toxytricini]|nr:hypothetical protein GCM10010286_01160 [Streptomyces toxytricini]